MRIESKHWGTPTEIAKQLGVPRTTLLTAVDAGHVRTTTTVGGSLLIEIRSAEAWASGKRKRGRKAKS